MITVRSWRARPGVFALLVWLLAGTPMQGQQRSLPVTSLVSDDPDSARRTIENLLARAAPAGADSADVLLSDAEQFAASFADVWGDSVPRRTVAWFRTVGGERRTGKAVADSLRRAGGTALRAEGLQPALGLWRASLEQATRVGDTIGVVAATANIGVAFYTAGEPDSAAAYLESAYRQALAVADYRAAGTAVGTLASIRKDREEYRAAAELYLRATALQERVGDTRGMAAAHNNLGLVAAAVGDTARAREAYGRALALNRRFKRPGAAASNLVNLGTLADLQGAYHQAARLYREALDAQVAEGDSLSTGLVLQNLGRLELRRGNYQAAVAGLTRALAIHQRIGPATAAHSVAIDLSRAQAATGALPDAVRTLDHAEGLGAGSGITDRDRASLALAQAELEARLNRLEAADRRLAAAERYFEATGDPGAQADAREERALLDLRRDRHRTARGHLRQALRLRELAGDVRALAGTRLLLGFAAAELGDTAEARRAYEASRATFARIGDAASEAEALGALGRLALVEHLPLSADSLYAAALARLEGQPAPPLAWGLHLGRGEALRASRATGEAARELRAAIAEIERSAGAFALPEIRSAFMADKWRPYAELAQLEHGRGAPDSAFAVSERMRAQVMLELLASARPSGGASGGDHTEVRDLRQRITQLTLRLVGSDAVPATWRGPAAPAQSQDAVREALRDAEGKYARALERMKQGDRRRGTLVPRPVLSAAEVQQRLRPGEIFLEYLVCDTMSVVFAVTSDTVAALDLDIGAKPLSRLVDFARGTIASGGSGEEELWRAPLQRLHEYLIGPVERTGLLEGRRRLYIAPHADLHYLPFAALLAPGATPRFLVERFAISYTPSASVWAQLPTPARPTASGRLLMLAPVSREALPGAAAEARRIARAYGREVTSLVGPEATEPSFRELGPDHRVIHLATFGVLNKQNPLFSYVALRPAGETDGRLEVHEIFGLSLKADLVVLSACQTALGAGALGDVPPGDDWVGLVQAFLYAGSARVLATAWPVADRPTASLMTTFYEELRTGAPEDVALGRAQRAALRRAETRSPLYWAGFVLTGGPQARISA